MRNFEFESAATTRKAIDLLETSEKNQEHRPQILAGGTDLLERMKEGLIAPVRLVNIKPNRDLRFLRFDPADGLSVGALTLLAEMEENSAVRDRYAGLAAAAATIASPQIRNMATVGGNLCQRPRCWYLRDEALHCARKGGSLCFAQGAENAYHAILGGSYCIVVHPSDLAPALIAYDASITWAGPEGSKTLPLEKFFVGPDEDITRETVLGPRDIVERVDVPPPPRGARGVYLKVRDRQTWDFAVASVAAVLEMEGRVCRRARIVLGGVAPIPWPAPEAERLLSGARIDAQVAGTAAEAALSGAQAVEHNAYKITLTRNLVRRAILQAAGA